ncbi:MAG: histone deacetylase, partial [Acidobacteriota bacterium]
MTRRPTEFVYSVDYQVDLGITPIDSLRPQKILTYLLSQSMIGAKSILRPEPASIRDLELAHSREYLDALRQPSALTEIVGFDVWPDLHEQLLQAQRAAVGGTMLATHRALRGSSIVVNLGGGFHHAGRSQGGGFCVFNDVAVAILQLRQSGFDKPILVVDLDLHDGNGTREIFATDDSVFTFSIHNQHWSREP